MTTQLFLAFDDLRSEFHKTMYEISDLSESGEPFGIKFNLDAILNPYTPFDYTVGVLKRFDRPLFADLKMWNGSRTMESIVKTFVDLGVDFVNVWAFADEQLEKAVRATQGSKTKILGLTVLSHYGDAHCQKWYGRNLHNAVADFSRCALDAGCHGIILPGTTLNVVKDLDTTKVATGIRPEWYKDDRHQQESTPTEIIKDGAHFAICGSPILKQSSKVGKITALRKVLEEMRKATV